LSESDAERDLMVIDREFITGLIKKMATTRNWWPYNKLLLKAHRTLDHVSILRPIVERWPCVPY